MEVSKNDKFTDYEQREYDETYLKWLEVRDIDNVSLEEYKRYLAARKIENNPKLTLVEYLGRARGTDWKEKEFEQGAREWQEYLVEKARKLVNEVQF